MDEGREREKTSRGGGLPTLPGLYHSTIQPSQRGFFWVHMCVWRERKPEAEFLNFLGPQPLIDGIDFLKAQCHEIFCFWFFSWISFPPAPEYPIRTVSNFFENLRRYSQVKVHHQYQRHRWQICHRCQRHQRQILPPVYLVLMIPAANLPPVSTTPAAILPPVSTTPVAICRRYQRHWRQICRRCQWHRWQIMGTISGCWDLKVNLKAKMFL